ncbi:MAG: ABC transporter ATP-binding protein [SAR202 cluster bacterium Io17-Chloro-G2]|nr:MAG: ABC transporter ATP-binding protein [SAR202 cluster bacterium Io17-Chloro-G2]
MNGARGNGASTPAITVNGLWKVFGKRGEKALAPEYQGIPRAEIQDALDCVVALRDVSFQVAEGETFVVMGLSGSGKSTLVRCIIRLIEPTAGEILIDGQDVLQFDDKTVNEFRRNQVAMVFQHYGLLPHRSVIENAAYGLEVRGVEQSERLDRAAAMLEKVGLSGREYAAPRELSGGMQQRVGLARALTVDPAILLMDEPFSGLDPLIRAQMREELAELQSEMKKTIVFITHDLDEAITVGGRIAIMRDGEIIQLGTPEEIVDSPTDEFVQEFTRGISKTRVLPISRIMEPPCCVASQDDSPKSVMQTMSMSNHSYVFITDENQECVGIATKEQIASCGADQQDSLENIDAHQPQAIPADTSIEKALPLIIGHDFPIPVTNDQGELLGMASQSAILEVIAQSAKDNAQPVEPAPASA